MMDKTIEFSLPNDLWLSVPPAAGQQFLAMRSGDFDVFRPNIAVDMAPLRPETTLEQLADTVAGRLRLVDPDLKIAKRQIDESKRTILQQVNTVARDEEGRAISLSQAQVIVVAESVEGGEFVTYCFMLTAEASSLGEYVEDFQQFVGSARIS
ncbi:hypothetical protein [Tessaracoccus sp. OH4464_COT-324]|uniref:hypothetical protein n=1 Tax=Tessaracoccus sp. OH4464_COT-324 TaxID=2491059 RepID=UPI000F63B583|nr:hypothetical protein [Tessaracoccus sp. OH4464_COT-324]RRD46818.1 hypothetical protein EII42_05125 [Tessaracoccus sp. OH4464_COT-324]